MGGLERRQGLERGDGLLVEMRVLGCHRRIRVEGLRRRRRRVVLVVVAAGVVELLARGAEGLLRRAVAARRRRLPVHRRAAVAAAVAPRRAAGRAAAVEAAASFQLAPRVADGLDDVGARVAHAGALGRELVEDRRRLLLGQLLQRAQGVLVELARGRAAAVGAAGLAVGRRLRAAAPRVVDRAVHVGAGVADGRAGLLEALRDGVGLGRLELGERAQGPRVEAVAHGLAERRRPESRGRGLHARRGRTQRQAAQACRARRHGRVVRRAQGAEADVARRGRRQRDAERSTRVARRHDLVDARRREAAEAAQRRRGDRVHCARSVSALVTLLWPRWLGAAQTGALCRLRAKLRVYAAAELGATHTAFARLRGESLRRQTPPAAAGTPRSRALRERASTRLSSSSNILTY